MNFLQRIISGHTTEFYLSFALLWLIPALTLTGLGVLYLWQAGWFWWFSLGLLALSLVTWGINYLAEENHQQSEAELVHLEPLPEWSTHDNEVWDNALEHMESSQLATTPWQDIPQAMHDQLIFVARLYHQDNTNAQYAFSLPELLLMLELWSRNYRDFVLEHAPLSQDVKISTIQNVSRKTETLSKIYNYANPLISIARTVINPASGIAAEIRSQLMSKAMGNLSEQLQYNLKQALFEQVIQLAIDLYSGRLKLSDHELSTYRQTQQPPEQPSPTPLSILLVGQVNAGKSSLLNALQAQCSAEVDVLPATDQYQYHQLSLPNGQETYIIDTPGLDGSVNQSKKLLQEAIKADLVLWLSQANQPAKSLDKEFYELWLCYFEENKSRKKPPIILVTTHNDLLPPAGIWKPPYDLEQEDNRKVASMLGALRYTQQAIGLPQDSLSVPISLTTGQEPYNIDILWELLLSVNDAARSAQLNKERLTGKARASIVSRGLKQSAGLLKIGLALTTK